MRAKVLGLDRTLAVAAAGEASTGIALLLAPALVGRLLLGDELSASAIVVARVVGISLIALGIACLPAKARVGMLTYSAAIAVYLAYLGLSGAAGGVLLWPMVLVHAVLTLFLARRSMQTSGHG